MPALPSASTLRGLSVALVLFASMNAATAQATQPAATTQPVQLGQPDQSAQPAQKPPTVYDGCQGEGCDCYAAYAEARNAGKPTDFPITAVRAFALHERLDSKSPVLGRFPAGTTARPVAQKIVVLNPGEFIVRKLAKPHPRVRVGDRVHTRFNEGEGDFSVMHKGTRVSFSHGEVELKTVRDSITENWTQLTVGKLTGYTPKSPFAGCLE